MRVKAYILVADPAWIENSLLSYYNAVDEIIASFDEKKLGYTGFPVAVDECLTRLQAIDRDGKIKYSPGNYARLGHTPMENETYQRQCALDQASQDADWVVQLDTDEVLADPDQFMTCLQTADEEGYKGLDYPARWLYCQLGNDRYLEMCTRYWGIVAGYPGSVAVKAGTPLRVARQCDVPLYRVDFRAKNTDPSRHGNTPVHEVIHSSQAIIHYSMVRDEETLKRKFKTWSHANDRDWDAEFKRWLWCTRHPYLASMTAPLPKRNRRHSSRLRISHIPASSVHGTVPSSMHMTTGTR